MNVLALALALAAQPSASAASSIEGTWRSPGGNSIIAIALCGSIALCGTVQWATDKAKKDAAKSTDQLVGAQIISDLQPDSRAGWNGKLFIPDRKMHVTARIERIGPDRLKVSGCAAGKALCKTNVWTAFSGPLPVDTSGPAPR